MPDPDLYMLLVAGCSLAALGAVTKIALALIARRKVLDLQLDRAALEERLARIEAAVESTAIEVERIGEGQRFTTRLLQERGLPGNAAPRPAEKSITPH